MTPSVVTTSSETQQTRGNLSETLTHTMSQLAALTRSFVPQVSGGMKSGLSFSRILLKRDTDTKMLACYYAAVDLL